jgi:hypothetical protein
MNDNSRGAESMFLIFATINEKMMEIAHQLRAKANVKSATSGCNIRHFTDTMSEERFLDCEAYAEAELTSSANFSWCFTLKKTSSHWVVQRMIYRQESHGGVDVGSFEDVEFEQFDALAERISTLLEEFANSAESFDFISQGVN